MRPDAVESTDQLWRSFRDRVRRIPAPWGVVVRAASPHPPGPPPEEAKRLAQELAHWLEEPSVASGDTVAMGDLSLPSWASGRAQMPNWPTRWEVTG
jgi:hypothetical protein